MNLSKLRSLIISSGLVSLMLSANVNAGFLYVTDAFSENLSVIDVTNSSLVNSVSTIGGALAVNDTVKIINDNGGNPAGSEFDLNGNLLNSGIFSAASYRNMYDGTTDGLYNYTIAHNDFNRADDGTPLFQNVLRFDQNWANPEVAFSITNRGSGITFDFLTDSLWTTEGESSPDDWIRQYDLQGNLLTSFDTGINIYALAWDSSDNTLWAGAGSNFYQYSTAGELLDTVTVAWGGSFVGGMEFSNSIPVPAPTTFVLFALGLAGIASSKNRRVK